MEKLDLNLRSCQAKTMGTVVSIAGALIITLYKGFAVTSSVMPNNLFLPSQQSQWLLGGFLLATSTFCGSLSLVIQVKLGGSFHFYENQFILVNILFVNYFTH